MTFTEFEQAVIAAGFTAIDRGHGHWQIAGGVALVNFYPTAKKPCIYMNGAVKGVRGKAVTVTNAIRCANGDFTPYEEKVGRLPRDQVQAIRRGLMRKSPRCHWCGKRLFRSTATLDHKIAVTRGGSNRADNLVLACQDCNQRRRNLTKRPEFVPVKTKPERSQS